MLVAPVYTAGEDPIEGADRDHLVASLTAHGHRDAGPVSRSSVATEVAKRAEAGDVVVCLGAGDITQWAYALPGELAELQD